MDIVINIGNSSIRFGFFKNDKCKCSWIINSKIERTNDELISTIKRQYKQHKLNSEKLKSVKNIFIGSVVPNLTNQVCRTLEKIHKIKPIIIDRNTSSLVKHNSNELGTDLYANLVGAYEINKKQSLIIDFGTALTISAVDNNGKILGVTITAGVNTSLQALIKNTSLLPDIELIPPQKVLGLDTISCIQSGIIYGYLAMVEGLIDRIKKEIGADTFVIATGGLCHIFESLTDKIDKTDKLHTIKGLYILGRNQTK